MPHDIRWISLQDFLRTDVTGKLDLKSSARLLSEIAAAASGKRGHHILIDLREAQGDMNAVELYALVSVLKELDLGIHNKVALLHRPKEGFDRARFFALLAESRGFNVAAFEDFEKALDWLNE